jgi:hypothetical protein
VRRWKQVSPFLSHVHSDHPPICSLAVAASGGEINNSFIRNVSSISIVSLYRYIVLIAKQNKNAYLTFSAVGFLFWHRYPVKYIKKQYESIVLTLLLRPKMYPRAPWSITLCMILRALEYSLRFRGFQRVMQMFYFQQCVKLFYVISLWKLIQLL